MTHDDLPTLLAVTIDARPQPDSPEFATYAGAIAVVYLDCGDEGEAVSRATQAVREQGWEPVSVDAVMPVQRADIESNEVALECFDGAIANGVATAFFGYPHGPDDGLPSH